MLWLSGGHSRALDAALPPGVGWMLQPGKGNQPTAGRWWAADTGCFRAPERFSWPGYVTWLRRQAYPERCLFATAPDVVGQARATLEAARSPLAALRALGYRAALVAQDGLEGLSVPWEAFDCLFVGGTTSWKLSEAAYRLVGEAKARGKWTHLGRVNSLRRLRAARVSGYDSADGTQLSFGPDKYLARVRAWLEDIQAQPGLPLWRPTQEAAWSSS